MREHEFDVTLAERWGEGLVYLEQGGTVEVDVRLESVHEGILASGEANAEYVGICGRCLIDLTSRFKTITWILKLWSGMRSFCRFRFNRYASRIAPGWTR